ncbi:MAG: hypothetical protein H7Z20_09915 [Bdellovibrio sp.]|nr:hypothetical protein [Methylotenera sp.]
MSIVTSLFDQAQLSEAAYANFLNSAGNLLTDVDSVKTALTTGDGKFSPAQATYFVAHWQVVSQYTAPPGLFGITDGTGFSGTVFKHIATNEYTFSLRGTEPGYSDLLGADAGDIVADGLALDQIMDMYNYWQSLTHTGVYQAKQLVTMTTETVALNAAYAISSVAGLAYEATLRANASIIIDYPSKRRMG